MSQSIKTQNILRMVKDEIWSSKLQNIYWNKTPLQPGFWLWLQNEISVSGIFTVCFADQIFYLPANTNIA